MFRIVCVTPSLVFAVLLIGCGAGTGVDEPMDVPEQAPESGPVESRPVEVITMPAIGEATTTPDPEPVPAVVTPAPEISSETEIHRSLRQLHSVG